MFLHGRGTFMMGKLLCNYENMSQVSGIFLKWTVRTITQGILEVVTRTYIQLPISICTCTWTPEHTGTIEMMMYSC